MMRRGAKKNRTASIYIQDDLKFDGRCVGTRILIFGLVERSDDHLEALIDRHDDLLRISIPP